MKEECRELRQAIYKTEAEFKRFRQLVVNAVLATDIMDKELKTLRNNRWEKAFSGNLKEESRRDHINRKATIVIEHLVQASDVSHTMQHWHIYRKWNALLFEEMYKAYLEGRAEKDPCDFWYQGEIGFFDFYIIPLARKLKDCGVFGVSSDEYLQYATNNRNEWVRKGEEVVEELIRNVKENTEYQMLLEQKHLGGAKQEPANEPVGPASEVAEPCHAEAVPDDAATPGSAAPEVSERIPAEQRATNGLLTSPSADTKQVLHKKNVIIEC